MSKMFLTLHHQQLTSRIVRGLPNEVTDEVLSYLEPQDLLILCDAIPLYRSYVYKILHQSRLWTAECYNDSRNFYNKSAADIILRCDKQLATPLQTAQNAHGIHIGNIRTMHLWVFVKPMCRTEHRSVKKFAKFLRPENSPKYGICGSLYILGIQRNTAMLRSRKTLSWRLEDCKALLHSTVHFVSI
jgi:hypothetical protein